MSEQRTVPIADFLELYDAAHAVIDHIRMHVDHAEYEGGMASAQRTLMPLSEAADALSQLAYDFHNVMLRQGTKELPPEEWMEEFRSWLPHGREFARQHAETIRWLEECERRAGR